MKLRAEWRKLTPGMRLHTLDVPIVGLTGGIATGKSTVAELLIEKGLPVINADLLVKEIYSKEETRNFIKRNYPEVILNNDIDFKKLREKVFTDSVVKDDVEAHIYGRLKNAFTEAYEKLGSPDFVVYDVPLLFEKKLDPVVDVKVLVYAPEDIQRKRLMARDGDEEDMARTIMASQLNIEDKKVRADFIIDNSSTKAELARKVEQFLRQVFE